MKVSIPLDSTLSTDSHANDIKEPGRDRDLFNKNRSYLYNGHLTNARKEEIPDDGYITTKGDILRIIPGTEKTQIYHNGRVIADVLSMGVEDISYIDKDDAVIDEGSLWTVQRTLTGYILEQTDLETKELTRTEVEESGILEVRFVRNTHKVITRNIDSSITIENVKYTDEAMGQYLSSFSGEFTAAEINGKIYFGYNNPAGVNRERPVTELNFTISTNPHGWVLRDEMDKVGADQEASYVININVTDGTIVDNGQNEFAMDLLTGITNRLNHIINITVGEHAYITGRGGRGGSSHGNTRNASGLTNGGDGTTAISCGSNLNLFPKTQGVPSVIQGGGGGGPGIRVTPTSQSGAYANTAGGGGAGFPPAQGGTASGARTNTNGTSGDINAGGEGNGPFMISYGGSPGAPGGVSGNTADNWRAAPGKGGNAIRISLPAAVTNNGVVVRGGIVEV